MITEAPKLFGLRFKNSVQIAKIYKNKINYDKCSILKMNGLC